MTTDFAIDMLEKLKEMGFQYHLVLFDPNGAEGSVNVHSFDNIEIDDSPVFLEALGESIENLGAEYEDFINWMEKEMKKDEKRAKKIKKLENGPIDPSI